jgi:hypothetical protein
MPTAKHRFGSIYCGDGASWRRKTYISSLQTKLKTTFVLDLLSKQVPAYCEHNSDMATYKDPSRCFAPIEVIERLLEIRGELGFTETLYLDRSQELTDFLDAYGFDIYAFSTENDKINYDDFSTPVVPGGDNLHCSITAH